MWATNRSVRARIGLVTVASLLAIARANAASIPEEALAKLEHDAYTTILYSVVEGDRPGYAAEALRSCNEVKSRAAQFDFHPGAAGWAEYCFGAYFEHFKKSKAACSHYAAAAKHFERDGGNGTRYISMIKASLAKLKC